MPARGAPARVTVRAKGQITLPAAIVEAAKLKPGDLLEVAYYPEWDVLRLWPVVAIPRPPQQEGAADG